MLEGREGKEAKTIRQHLYASSRSRSQPTQHKKICKRAGNKTPNLKSCSNDNVKEKEERPSAYLYST